MYRRAMLRLLHNLRKNNMTNDELMTKAGNIAKTFFYADNEGTLWPDFEGHSEAWINKQIDDMQQTIYHTFKGKL